MEKGDGVKMNTPEKMDSLSVIEASVINEEASTINEEDYVVKIEEEKGDEYYPLPQNPKKRTMLFSALSVVLAVLSISLAVFYIPSLILGVLSIGAAVYSRLILGFFDKLTLIGLILGIFGVIFGVGSLILTLSGVMAGLLG